MRVAERLIIFNISSAHKGNQMWWKKGPMQYFCLFIWVLPMLCFSEELEDFLSALEAKDYFKHASVSVYVQDQNGHVILDYQGEKSLIPNSILKVFTTGAALDLLGEEFHFHTKLLTTGTVKEGVLEGDLVILGDGDPTLGQADYQKLFKEWAQALEAYHIHTIRGSVIGDGSCFEQALSSPTWLWEDLGNYYGAGACGLNFHENAYSLLFKLGKQVGDATQIAEIQPDLFHVKVHNKVVSGPPGSGDKAWIFGGEFATEQYVRGSLPLDAPTFTIRGSIPDPAQCCAQHLREVLIGEGITIKGNAISSFQPVTYPKSMIIAELYSSSLDKIVFAANQRSMNLYCECFLKKMGKKLFQEGTYQAGLRALHQHLDRLKIPLKGCRILDGSGLSNKNLLTAKSVVSYLSKVSQEPYFPTLYQSLPSNSYGADKFLQRVFSSPQLKERIRAKTGFSSQGESFAGFLSTDKGNTLSFCVIANHCAEVSMLRKDLEKLFQLLLVH